MRLHVVVFASLFAGAPLLAQGSQDPRPEQPDTAGKLHGINITAAPSERERDRVSAIQRVTLPAIAGITARKAEETGNLVDTQDAIKYLPSVFIRKRNYGDTQATMATRTWG